MDNMMSSQMTAKKWHILLVDNDCDQLRIWKAALVDAGYTRIDTAANDALAHKRFSRGGIDLVVTDIRLQDDDDGEDKSGLVLAADLCRLVPVIVMTRRPSESYVYEALDPLRDTGSPAIIYVSAKDQGSAKLIEAVGRAPEVYRRYVRSNPPYPPVEHGTVVALTCSYKQPIGIHSGNMSYRTKGMLARNPPGYGVGAETPGAKWRADSRTTGIDLFERIFRHAEVRDNYRRLQGELSHEPESLRLRFKCSLDFLQEPIECLFDEEPPGHHVVLQHPLSRSVLGVSPTRAALSPAILNELKADNRPLRVLLIASNTPPEIPDVDEEIYEVGHLLRKQCKAQGLRAVVDAWPTNRAALGAVEQAITSGHYDIIHYAGHSSFNESLPERSMLCFWQRANRQGKPMFVPISQLTGWLSESDVRFMYLSSCDSAQLGTADQLINNDFLGISDGILCAGVAAVLGLRWPLYGGSARRLALAFYEELVKTGRLDVALWKARNKIAELDRRDPTWLSPILIMQ